MLDDAVLSAAVLNNIRWYEAVLGAHGVPSEVDEHYWSTDAVTPPYYGNLVTRTPDGIAAQVARARELVQPAPRPDWGMKDSFDRLSAGELEALGLRVLFDACWYGLAPGEGNDGGSESGAEFVAVETVDELARWERAWQVTSPAPGLRVFPPALLGDPGVVFLAAVRDGDLVGGLATNLSDGAVGLSNLFAQASRNDAPLLRDAARYVRRLHPERPLVGYGPAAEAEELASIGFGNLGPLRVWVSRGPRP